MAYNESEKELIRRLTLADGGDDPDWETYAEFNEDDPTDDRLRREYAAAQIEIAERTRALTNSEQASVDRWARMAEEMN